MTCLRYKLFLLTYLKDYILGKKYKDMLSYIHKYCLALIFCASLSYNPDSDQINSVLPRLPRYWSWTWYNKKESFELHHENQCNWNKYILAFSMMNVGHWVQRTLCNHCCVQRIFHIATSLTVFSSSWIVMHILQHV